MWKKEKAFYYYHANTLLRFYLAKLDVDLGTSGAIFIVESQICVGFLL